MGLPPDETPLSTPPPPTGMERIEAGIAYVFAGPQGIRAGWRYITFFLAYGICSGLLILVAVSAGILHLKAGKLDIALNARGVFWGEIITVTGLFVAALLMSKIERRPMGQYGLPLSEAFGRRFWEGVIWGIVGITVMMLLIAAFHGFSFGSISLSGSILVKYALVWGGAFLLTGFSEEFLFRGYGQFTLATGMGFWPAAILLSLLFGAIHLGNPGESWIGGLSAGLIGFFFCFTLRRTGTIWFAVGLHAAWDYGETFIYGVPDSGLVAPGHLLNSSFHGPRWLTGGEVGPEASVFCFVVILLMFLLVHLIYPAQSSAGNQP